MQNVEDIAQKYFTECKNIIAELMDADDIQTLIENKAKIDELNEKISFLKIWNQTPELQCFTSNEAHLTENVIIKEEQFEFNEVVSEEEVIFDSETKVESLQSEPELPKFEFAHSEHQIEEEAQELPLEEEIFDEKIETSVAEESASEEIVKQPIAEEKLEELISESTISQEVYERNVGEMEREQREAEERRRKIIEFEKNAERPKEKYFEETAHHNQKPEKKFKLAHIKGLKVVQSLFDDDPLEELEEPKKEEPKTSGSILKSNVPTDFMEAEKHKQEFKLDLNDRIAFTKTLFGGSQTDLNDAVTKLNSFKTLDEAKEYLSEIYYQKNWKKHDEFAQRLWHLVENKFL